MNDDAERRGELEENVRRLFGRLERTAPVSPTARSRILARLLEEVSAPPPRRAGHGVGRWIRWVGLAAALVVGTGLLTDDLFDPGRPRGREAAAGGVGSPPRDSSADVPIVSFAIHLLATGPGRGVVEAASAEGGAPVHILPERHVSNTDVESARVEGADSQCRVSIRLTEEGTTKLARLTRDHIGDRLALVIDGEVAMTPTIRSEITQGEVLLTGDFSASRCEEIARGLSTRP